MTQAIRTGGREVTRVGIVDDDAYVRDSYRYTIADAGLEPVEYGDGLAEKPAGAVERFKRECQAALCDYRLTVSGYASYNGTELVVACYHEGFPAVLCSSYETTSDELRVFLPWMPVRLNESELDPDSVRLAIETCLTELVVGRPAYREPWRTLVHVEHVQDQFCYVLVPAWDTHVKVRIRRSDLPQNLQDEVHEDWRGYAKVNLGAESLVDLFFMDWERA